VTLLTIMFWSFVSGFALGMIDALTFSPSWKRLLGG
jgi:hypothetical protein